MADNGRQRRRGRGRSSGRGGRGGRGGGGDGGDGNRSPRRGSGGPPGQGRPPRSRAASQRKSGRGLRVPELCELSPFSVFCALHLGITEDDGYAPGDYRAVARRFDLSPAELDAYLESHHLSEQALRAAGFDLSSARLDIEVAPEGISRLELARPLFEEACEGPAAAER